MPKPAHGDWCQQYAERKNPEDMPSDAPFANFGDEYAQNSLRHYYANITFIDDQIGEIIRCLKEKDMYDNTTGISARWSAWAWQKRRFP